MLKILYYKHGCLDGAKSSSIVQHDAQATVRAIAELAEAQGLRCEASYMHSLDEIQGCDMLVLPYPDQQADLGTRLVFGKAAQQAKLHSKPLVNLLTDVDPRFSNTRAPGQPLLAEYDHVWYTQSSAQAAKRVFAQAAVDWRSAQWSYFPQTQLGFASQLEHVARNEAAPLPDSWLYDCVYYGIHKQSRAERLSSYLNSQEFASACYGSQTCGAQLRHVDTELRLKTKVVLSTLLPASKFSLYVTCPGHYNSACFRLVEAALAGRACLIDEASAEVGSFGLGSKFFVQSAADIASMCAKSNAELALLYEEYRSSLLKWCYALRSDTVDFAKQVEL